MAKTKLTKKERGFVKDYVLTENGTRAVKKNYEVSTDGSARSIATENLTKPHIQEAIAEVKKTLAEAIPDELLTQRHLDLLNKKEVKRTFNHETGEWIEIETGQIDTEAVKAGVKMAYELKGSFVKENQTQVNILMPVLVKFLDKQQDEGTNKANNS